MNNNSEIKDLYFNDKLLISTNNLYGSFFDKTVIYMVSHSPEGAMGIIINKKIQDSSLADIAEQFDIEKTDIIYKSPIYFGGPVEVGKGFVVHTNEYISDNTMDNKNGIATTSNIEILEDIAKGKGPKKYIVSLGYAGWEAGQLEKEMYENSWIIVHSDIELVFDFKDSQKWVQSAKKIGVDINRLSEISGNA